MDLYIHNYIGPRLGVCSTGCRPRRYKARWLREPWRHYVTTPRPLPDRPPQHSALFRVDSNWLQEPARSLPAPVSAVADPSPPGKARGHRGPCQTTRLPLPTPPSGKPHTRPDRLAGRTGRYRNLEAPPCLTVRTSPAFCLDWASFVFCLFLFFVFSPPPSFLPPPPPTPCCVVFHSSAVTLILKWLK